MNKNIFIGVGFIAVLGLIALIYATLSKSVHQDQPPVTNSFPTTTTIDVTPSDDTLSIAGADGKEIQTRNFLRDTDTAPDPVNKGYYYLGNHMPFDTITISSSTPKIPYTIFYIASTHYFNISLLEEPLADSRLSAEKYLAGHLGIPKEQLCSLQYQVSVPNYVNSQLAGDSLGFSFCPGATEL